MHQDPLSRPASQRLSREEFQGFADQYLTTIVDSLTPNQQHRLYEQLTKITELDKIQDARDHLLPFMQYVWIKHPPLMISNHHVLIANVLEAMERGELKRCCISTPPRYTKTELISIHYPAWIMGVNPHADTKVMLCTNTQDLATKNGRDTKAVIESERYRNVFPGLNISREQKAASDFALETGASYRAYGTTSSILGFGSSHLIIDDPYSNEDVRTSNWETAEQFYHIALTRLQPGAKVAILCTRMSKVDIIGTILDRAKRNPRLPKWNEIRIPALDEDEKSTFPNFWPTEEVLERREELLEKAPHIWFSNYQNNPTAEGNTIIKRSDWRRWDKRDKDGNFETPEYFYCLIAFDLAYTANKRSNPTAATVWGVWKPEDSDQNHAVLLHSFARKMEPTELTQVTIDLIKEWKPDTVLIEKAAGSAWVVRDFRAAGISATEVRAEGDKMTRLNSVQPTFADKKVWYIPTPENEKTVEEVICFPNAEDDLTDTCAYALRHIRKGQLVRTIFDEKFDDEPVYRGDCAYYP
jgi:predicted phage terminase large subunit-like protein